MKRFGLPGFVLVAVALATLPAGGAVIPVTTLADSLAGPECSLRAAVVAASTDAPVAGCAAGEPGLDRIELGSGVHLLTLVGPDEDAGLTGDLDVSGPLEIAGAGRDTTFIQWNGAPADRLLDVAPGASLELSGVTLRYGATAGRGGLVRVDGTATLRDCALRDGEAVFGGGVGVGPGGNLSVERCEIEGNVGDGGGIGAGLRASLFVRSSQVHDNESLAQGGGGILGSFADLIVEDSEVDGNSADDSRWGGGGLLVIGGSLALRRSTVAANSASDAQADGSVADPRFDESGGGALSLRGARAEIESSTLSGNHADEARLGGGGILAVFSDVRIAYSTLVSNTSALSGALPSGGSLARWDNARPEAELHLTHSLVSSGGPECFATAAITGAGNRIDDASCGADAGSLGAVSGLDPTLAGNGGPTRTHRLLAGSNALDAGPAACLGTTGLPLLLGQRGVARPQNGACDLGAVERSQESHPRVVAAALLPAVLPEPGGTVQVSLALGNDGPLPLEVVTLASPELGNLAGGGTCQLPLWIESGEVALCESSGHIAGSSGFYPVEISLGSADIDGGAGADNATLELAITDDRGRFELTAAAHPDFVEAPGGATEITLRVRNLTEARLTLTDLWEGTLGSLGGRGTCVAGGAVDPGAEYVCRYPVAVSGLAGEVIVHGLAVRAVGPGTDVSIAGTEASIEVIPTGSFLFADSFESGDTSAWTTTVP